MALSPVLLAFTVITLTFNAHGHGVESAAELYWKMKFGNGTVMPRIVKEGLLGSEKNGKSLMNYLMNKGFVLTNKQEASIFKDVEIMEYMESFVVTNKLLASINQVERIFLYNPDKQHQTAIDPSQHSVYFTEKDIYSGKVIKLNFMNSPDDAKFLPVQVAESIPFTSTKLQEIMSIFNVKPKSTEAKIVAETLKACESKTKGEHKFCSTTLAGMVNFVTSHVGNNVTTVSTYIGKEIQSKHRIESAKRIGNDRNMVCHKMGYPYAVFYCHKIKDTNIYDISLVGADGEKINAIAACHRDTSTWSPTHISFMILNVKPGSPVCHFLSERSMAFIPKT